MSTDPETYQLVMEAFLHVRGLPAADRPAYLESIRGRSADVARTVESMLHHDEHPAPILDMTAAAALDPSHGFSMDDRGTAWLPYSIGGYRILRLVGRGGMGSVFEAVQGSPPRRVALKAINPASALHLDPSKFEQEARVLARLEHPGIARVYEAGRAQEGGIRFPFFAMELIEGSTITDHAAEHALGIPEKIRLMISICEAVQYAHEKGVLHRDLKPDNILVDAFGQPKLLDFGLARSIAIGGPFGTLHTVQAQPAGTPAYMSPEQAAGLPIDARSDLYSLGVVLHELLSGQRPGPRASAPTIILHGHVVAPSVHAPLGRLNKQLRGDLETIVAKTIEADPDRRYASVQALADDLRRYLAGQPIDARPRSLAYTVSTKLRRARRASGAVATLLAFTAGVSLAVVFSSIYYKHQNVLTEAAAFRDVGERLQVSRAADGTVLDQRPPDGEALRERIAGLARQDRDLERRLLVFAGNNLTRFGPGKAHLELGETLLRSAKFADRSGPQPRMWEIDAVLADNLLRQGRIENACELLVRVVSESRADRSRLPPWVSRSFQQAAEAYASAGEPLQAAACLEAALMNLPGQRPSRPAEASERIQLLVRQASLALSLGDLESAGYYRAAARQAFEALTPGRAPAAAGDLAELDRAFTGAWLQNASGLPHMSRGR